MKCEYEGCIADGEQIRIVRFDLLLMPVTDSPVLCHHHLAEWVREYADEIEGVKECEECEGHGRCFNEGEGYTCDKCNGTGKVPNGLGFFVGWIARGKVPR